jgi:hypothetical protein
MCAQLFDDVCLALASCRRDPRMDELSSRFYDWGSNHGQLCNGEQTPCIYHILFKMCLNEAIDIQYLKNVYFTTSSPATSRALLICLVIQIEAIDKGSFIVARIGLKTLRCGACGSRLRW